MNDHEARSAAAGDPHDARTRLTGRGFRIYLDGPSDGCAGVALSVVESSVAFEGAHVRIYHGEDEHVQLHVDAAEMVAHALLEFVAEARAGNLTEPVYREDGTHGHNLIGVESS